MVLYHRNWVQFLSDGYRKNQIFQSIFAGDGILHFFGSVNRNLGNF